MFWVLGGIYVSGLAWLIIPQTGLLSRTGYLSFYEQLDRAPTSFGCLFEPTVSLSTEYCSGISSCHVGLTDRQTKKLGQA